MTLVGPLPISRAHLTSGFDCGQPALDRWLVRHALANEVTGRSRTFVLVDKASLLVVGYYCLSTAVVEYAHASARAVRGMPKNEPLPAVLLGRLAVDRKLQGQRLGSILLADAVGRTYYEIARNAGVRLLLVHAKDDDARRFYLDRGFTPSPTDPLHVMLVMQDVPKSR